MALVETYPSSGSTWAASSHAHKFQARNKNCQGKVLFETLTAGSSAYDEVVFAVVVVVLISEDAYHVSFVFLALIGMYHVIQNKPVQVKCFPKLFLIN